MTDLGGVFDYLDDGDLSDLKAAYPDYVITHVPGGKWYALPLTLGHVDRIEADTPQGLAQRMETDRDQLRHQRGPRRGEGDAWTS